MRKNNLTIETVFDNSVPEPNTGCWLWNKATQRQGYGLWQGFGCRLAHRISWIIANGNYIPHVKQLICHKCDNPTCVNPDHLYLGTHEDNAKDRERGRRGVQSRKTHCHNGHIFDSKNTYITTKGFRMCRECNRRAGKAYQKRKCET